MRQADRITRLGGTRAGPHFLSLVLSRLRLPLRGDRDLRRQAGGAGTARRLKELRRPAFSPVIQYGQSGTRGYPSAEAVQQLSSSGSSPYDSTGSSSSNGSGSFTA